MATLAEKLYAQSGHEPLTSPSPTLAPSLRHSTEAHPYPQHKGTKDTIIVDWEPDDPENPMNWKTGFRQCIGGLVGLSAFCVAFSSSAYAAAVPGIMKEFDSNLDVALLGLSLFLYGRRTVFIVSFFPYTLFHLGAGLSKNITTLLLMRLLGGCFGSSVFSVPAGSLADVFTKEERGPLALLVLAVSPLFGPVCGPLVGGFIAQSNVSWHWNFWVMLIFSGVVFVLYVAFVPETCHMVLLRRRAAKLQSESSSGVIYITKYDTAEHKSLLEVLQTTLVRPLAMLVYEPIVLVLSLYTALVYGILYGFFAAFPIVFQRHRHFTAGETGLAFIGIGVGIFIAVVIAPFENRRYLRAVQKAGGHAPPEQRLIGGCVAAILLPISLIWFSWTTYPSVHWIVPILAGVPFGIGAILGFTSVVAYMVDSYPLYAASCLAANGILRSTVAFAFPLFIPHLFDKAGDQWGSMFCAFLALACVPIPFILFVGGKIDPSFHHN
ncbi:hypothetical protein FRC08_003787 [Ceratobasidium sp. 394]|nr:hypothetical protein FRC08_003787 [Ceratobasidium sp. 394]